MSQSKIDSHFPADKPIQRQPAPKLKTEQVPLVDPSPTAITAKSEEQFKEDSSASKKEELSQPEEEEVDVSKLTDEQIEDILRTFDVNHTYGPFTGMDREFRWHRAKHWGLDPPAIVKRIFETREYIERRPKEMSY